MSDLYADRALVSRRSHIELTMWNYRVCKTEVAGEPCFDIREVYYRDDGAVSAWTADACWPYGESLEELHEDVQRFLAAFELPVLSLPAS